MLFIDDLSFQGTGNNACLYYNAYIYVHATKFSTILDPSNVLFWYLKCNSYANKISFW